MNGVETLFNVEPGDVEGRTVRTFALDVLCRCPNTSGVRLSVKKEGLLAPFGISVGVLPLVPGVDHWTFTTCAAAGPTRRRACSPARGGRRTYFAAGPVLSHVAGKK